MRIDLTKTNSTVLVAIHEDRDMRAKVIAFAVDTVKKAGDKGIELGLLGQKIHSEFPKFNVKEFGYSTLSKFIYGIKDLKIENDGSRMKIFGR